MAPPDLRRPFKRAAISDQQRRRELSLQRQAQNRRDAQHQARCLAQTILSLQNDSSEPELELERVPVVEFETMPHDEEQAQDFDVRQAARLRGPEARRWFAKQLMLPEWMIDVPDGLNADWYADFSFSNHFPLYLHILKLSYSYSSSWYLIFYSVENLNSKPMLSINQTKTCFDWKSKTCL